MKDLRKIIVEAAGLTEEQYVLLMEAGKMVQLKKKQYLISAGSTCNFIGFVEEGVLRSFIQKEGEDFNVDFYLSGSFVSAYTSFLTQTPASGSIQALADAKVFLLSRDAYHTLLHKDDSWFKLGKLLSDNLFMRKCRRETSLLANSASERYQLLLKSYPRIEQLVPQYHIASYLGIKPESLSRLKSLTYINEMM